MERTNNAIAELRDCVDIAYNTIAEKGGEVPENRSLVNLPDAIGTVKPKLEEITATDNGIYTPSEGFDGFRKVSVDVQPVLEELTITENGTYTPQDGVDGFSKVVANVVSTKKVVLPNGTRISNTQIIDGYWAGELVDTSTMTNMDSMFYNCSQLKSLDVSNWDISNVRGMIKIFNGCSSLQQLEVSNWDISNIYSTYSIFYNCSQLQQLDVSNWDVSNITNMSSTFRGCSSLQQLDISKWNVSNAINTDLMFAGCGQLQTLDISKWNVSSLNNAIHMFEGCTSLQSLIGNRTIEHVIANNIGALNGLKVSANMFLKANNIDRASLRAVINGLAEVETTQTLTLGATLRAKLTEEDIAIATAKNWSIS